MRLSLPPSLLSVLAVVGMSALAPAQATPWPLSPFSTHDWTDPSTGLPESCADVKTPGNGRTYMVGTIGVTNTDPLSPVPPTFSGVAIDSPPVAATSHWISGRKDTAFLQCSDANGIRWQTYFYGDPPSFGGLPNNFFGSRSTARAVSVYAMPNEADTRIAICGETFDASIPGDSNARQNYSSSGGLTSGYIAVFDGSGQLLWSRLIFGTNPFNDDRTVITDVSIRVEAIGGQNLDVVTYCGVTTAGTTIGPVRAFPPTQPHPLGNQGVAGGATHNGLPGSLAGNWDGLIGREWADPNDPRRFRALVGGGYQDGLFGLAEIDSHRFAVVGTTASLGGIPPSSPCGGTPCAFEFPLTDWTTFNDPTPFISDQQAFHFQLGVFAIVDATATRSGGALTMERSELIGSRSIQNVSIRHTVARDVACLGANILVVGSTDDPQFTQPFESPTALPGAVSGYALLTRAPLGGTKAHAIYLSASGGFEESVGVAGWSEYPDHATVVGRARTPNLADQDLVTYKVLVDTTQGTSLPRLTKLQHEKVPATDFETVAELPAGNGTLNMYPNQALLWATASAGFTRYQLGQVLGDPFGGGVCVDSRGRGTIVGTTFSHDYPVEGLGRAVSVWTTPNVNCDGVRTEVDLLPSGACRTDGTSGLFPPPFVRASGDGGTTPTAALPPFGLQIMGNVPGPIRRMLIDLDGMTFAGAAASVLVDRPPPPAVSPGYGTFLQIGPPVANPIAIAGMPGVEVWTTNSPVFTFYAPHDGTLRVPLWPTGLPSGSWTFALQFFAAYPGSFPFAATPALIITY